MDETDKVAQFFKNPTNIFGEATKKTEIEEKEDSNQNEEKKTIPRPEQSEAQII